MRSLLYGWGGSPPKRLNESRWGQMDGLTQIKMGRGKTDIRLWLKVSDPYYILKHRKILNYTPNFELKRNKSTDKELLSSGGTSTVDLVCVCIYLSIFCLSCPSALNF